MQLQTLSTLCAIAVGLVVVGVAPQWGAIGCARAESAAPKTLRVFFSNETEAELYPCFCRTHQMGGLSRRASVIAAADDRPELVLDAGNFSSSHYCDEYVRLKETTLLKVYGLLDYAALNVGPDELKHGRSGLQRLVTETGGKLVSANVRDAAGGEVVPPYRIVNIEGLEIAVIGLVDPTASTLLAQIPDRDAVTDAHIRRDPDQELSLRDPIDSLVDLWPAIERESDFQILLSQLTDEQLAAVIGAFPTIDLVLGGPNWEMTNVTMVNNVPTAKVGQRGKYLGKIDLELDSTDRQNVIAAHASGSFIGMDSSIPDNPRIEQTMEEFKETLRSGAVQQSTYDPYTWDAQYGFGGAQNCKRCHLAIVAGWSQTPHAAAFETLVEKSEQHNPGCLECHTVGYAEKGGYLEKGNSYWLAGVQCENCHGSGAEHMRLAMDMEKAPESVAPSDWRIARDSTKSTCIRCHQPDQDPHWSADEKTWPYAEMVKQVECSQWVNQPNVPIPGPK